MLTIIKDHLEDGTIAGNRLQAVWYHLYYSSHPWIDGHRSSVIYQQVGQHCKRGFVPQFGILSI